MLKGSCHCGAVTFILNAVPEHLTACNCSVCRRIGALWAHDSIEKFEIQSSGETSTYIWGDKSLAFHSCKNCGCTTHWANLDPGGDVMAVNCRMVDPEDVVSIPVKQFDGADSWEYLD